MRNSIIVSLIFFGLCCADQSFGITPDQPRPRLVIPPYDPLVTFNNLVAQGSSVATLTIFVLPTMPNVNTRDRFGRLPLAQALLHNRLDIAQWLLNTLGAQPQLIRPNEVDQRSLNRIFLSAVIEHNVAMMQFLLSLGADANSIMRDIIPLHIAAIDGNPAMAQLLLSWGADPNILNDAHMTPLMYAAIEGHSDIVRHLLAAPQVDVNAQSTNGETALMFAARYNHPNQVGLLLQAGANPHLKDTQGKTAYDYARENGNQAVVMLLEMFR